MINTTLFKKHRKTEKKVYQENNVLVLVNIFLPICVSHGEVLGLQLN